MPFLPPVFFTPVTVTVALGAAVPLTVSVLPATRQVYPLSAEKLNLCRILFVSVNVAVYCEPSHLSSLVSPPDGVLLQKLGVVV